MKTLIIAISLVIMFSNNRGVSSESWGQSCSSVNGQWVCEEQKSNGNMAGAMSQARTGPGGSFMGANAATGNTNTGAFRSSTTQVGNPPGSFFPSAGSWSSSQAGNPQAAAGGFGFASAGAGAGVFPFFPFAPGIVYPPPQDSAGQNGQPPQGPMPSFNPFAFVNGQMGGGFPFGFAGRR